MHTKSSRHKRESSGQAASVQLRFRPIHAVIFVVVASLGIIVPTPAGQVARGQPGQPIVSLAVPDATAIELAAQAKRGDELGWLRSELGAAVWPSGAASRSDLVNERHQLRASGDVIGAARRNGILAAEAQIRASRVLTRWRGRLDPETGLLPKGVEPDDHLWDYADAGADLFPHLLIAAHLLSHDASPLLTAVIDNERRIGGPGLPRNVDLETNRPDPRRRDQMYGAVEYAKDGLLPLTERLGPGPWLDRMQEIMQAVDDGSTVQTRFGPIPSEEGEVNGQALQVFARLFWATGDMRYRVAASRIAHAYLDQVLPDTDWIPTRSWDFDRERADTSVVQLRDHGNEIVAGLVEYHLIETTLELPEAVDHRLRIRKMLDRLLVVGRDGDGMWRSAIDLKTGQSLKDTLSDNWGYLYAAYLTQALIEEHWPGQDGTVARQYADRYRAAAREGLVGVSNLDLYPWQGTEQDGYADTIESALYLLNRLDVPTAARWTDRQAGTLFGAQADDGRVEDRYLDGNFVRTALLYAAWRSGGTRLQPWSASATVGAERDGPCMAIVVVTGEDWNGRLVFDRPRHAAHLHLPLNYPRLNEWPEWFTVQEGASYRVEDILTGRASIFGAPALIDGLPLALTAGAEQQFRVCPAHG